MRYQDSMKEIGQAFNQDDALFEMRQLNEKHLSEILSLQKEKDQLAKELQSLKATHDALKHSCQGMESEKATLLNLCEDLQAQLKETHNGLENSMNRVQNLEQ